MPDKKTLLILFTLTALSIVFTIYSLRAYAVASRVFEGDGSHRPVWRTSPPGSFLLWPKEPGLLEALSEMSDIDMAIYLYLVKSQVLIVLSVALWAVTCLYVFRKVLKRRSD
ncbi:MAG: hypothetical protein QXR06_04910 [Candidatus Bathyarchaeia archaeon]|nr:hypothetical protein [Candidatus Bathyarchaeota archaeon]